MTDKRTLVFALESCIEKARDDEELEKMVIAYLREADSPVWQRWSSSSCQICGAPTLGKLVVCEEHISGALAGGLGAEPKEDRRCSHDGGKCHHDCEEGKCLRMEGGMSLSKPWPGYPKESSEEAAAEAFGPGSQLHRMVRNADNVDHPKHYTFGKIEVIDAIEDWQLGFHEGNVVKYVARAKHKERELEDLKKAAWYLNRRIEELSK